MAGAAEMEYQSSPAAANLLIVNRHDAVQEHSGIIFGADGDPAQALTIAALLAQRLRRAR